MENKTFYNEVLTDHNLHPGHKHALDDANMILEVLIQAVVMTFFSILNLRTELSKMVHFRVTAVLYHRHQLI